MVNFSFLGIVLIGVLFLVAPSYQRGNLYADTIFSSSETVITIDTLEGGNSEITNSKTDTVSFGNFDTVSLEAQSLSLAGSFVLLEGASSVNLVSSDGYGVLSAGNNLDVNGNTVAITTNQGDIEFVTEQGELNFVAGSQFVSTSQGFDILTEVGGVLLNSQGGDVAIQSSGNLIINSNDEFNVRSTYDILFTTPKDITIASDAGELDVASLHGINVNAEDSITISSVGERISFNAGDYIIANTESLTANGNNELKIQSFTSSVKLNSFGMTSFHSNQDLTIQGDTKGISLFSTGENTGIIQLTSTSRSIYFTSEGNGDEETGILANVGSFSGSVTRSANLISHGDGVIRSNGELHIDSGSAFEIDTQNVDIHTYDMAVTSAADFNLKANNIYVYAFDEASSGNALGLVDIAAANVRYNAQQDIVLHGGDLTFTAGTGDLELSANDITLSASRGDNSQHSITVTGTDLQYVGDNAFFFGGDVDINGASQDNFAGGNIQMISHSISPNFIRNVAGDDIEFSIPEGTMSHTTTELTFYSFYAEGDSAQSGISFSTGGAITADSDNGYDITFISKTTFDVNSQDNIIFQVFDAEIDVTDSFSANGDVMQINANDFSLNAYSLYFDSLDSDPTTVDQDIQFDAGRNFVFSTPRNENGDDSISATYTTLTLDQEDLFFTGIEEGSFNAGDFTILSDSITVSSDDRENINFQIASLSLTTTEDLHYDGDSVTFAAPSSETFINSTGDVTLNNDDRGLLIDSEGSFQASANASSISTPDNILIDSADSVTFNTGDEFQINSGESINIYSSEGPVALLNSNGTFAVNSANNINFNTGDYQGDLFSTNSQNVYFDASNSVSTSVAVGNLDINVADDTHLSSNAISFVGAGVVTIQTAAYSLSTNDFDNFGGNIDISSTVGDITFVAATDFLINSTESSLAGQEIDEITYEILFSSGDDISIATATSGQIYSKSDNLVIQALKPADGQEGEILLAGSNTTLTSGLLNQFIQFTSGGLLNITANDEITIDSNGDYFIEAANSAQFYAASISHSMHESITIDAITNSCVNISHIGNNLNFQVTTPSVPKLYNDLEFKATDYVYIQAGDGPIVATANGASTKRQNEDGNTNGDLVLNQEISISLRSRDELGNIIFEAQDDVVSFNADDNTIITTLQQALFYTLTGQSYYAGDSTKFEAESGNVTMRAGHDYTLTASDSLSFLSTQNTTVLAEDYIYITTQNALEITANSGDIFFNTYNKNDINVDGNGIFFNSGTSGARFIAQGDISTVSTTYSLSGERGINLLTNVGPILFDSQSSTSLSSSEELFVRSGNNVITTSTTSTSFTGKGVVFGSTAADVLLQSNNDVLLTSKTAVLESFGTSQSSRDRVAFNSPDITFQSLSVHVDATELVQIGKTTLPVVSITASGTEAISGVVIDIAASTFFNTEGQLVFSSVLGGNNITATSAATFDAEGSIDIENSNFNIQAITGTVLFNANDDIIITVANSALYQSGHFLQFSSTDSDVNDGILFNFDSLEVSGHFMNTRVNNQYVVNVDDFLLASTVQGGAVRFEAPLGFIQIAATTDVQIGARSDVTISSVVDTSFTSFVLNFATLFGGELSPITLQAQNDFSLETANTISFAGDYVTVNTYGPGASISYATDDLTINSSEGSFISNSTLGSQSFNPTDLTMNIANYAHFQFANANPFNVDTGSFVVASTIGSLSATGDVLLDTTTFLTSAAQDLSFIAVNDIVFEPLPAGTLAITFTSTSEDTFITTTNDINHINIQTGSLDVDTYSLNFRAGSEQEREDLRLLTGSLGITGTQTSFISQPTGIRVASPVSVTYPIVTFASEYITFNSTSKEEGFGGIFIGDTDLSNPIGVTANTGDIVFLSESARVITEVDDVITFDADSMLMNTNGIDTVIKFDSTISTTLNGDTMSIFSETKTRIASDAGNLLVHGNSIGIEVNGPNDGDGNGIVMTGTYSNTISSADLTVNVDATRFSALTEIDIASANVEFLASNILINAQGGRENPVYQPFTTPDYYYPYPGTQTGFVGVDIDTPDFDVTADTDLTYLSEILYHNGNFDANVAGNMQFNARENFQVQTTGQTQITTGNFLLNTQKGITLLGQGTTGSTLAVNAAGSVLAEAGNDYPDSRLFFTSTGGDISFTATSAGSGIISYSNDNILYESSEDIGVNSAGAMTIRATRGDILFRSISVSSVHIGTTTPTYSDLTVVSTTSDIYLRAGRSIRHIDHWGLGFFDPSSQAGRPGGPRNIAGNLVTDRAPGVYYGTFFDCTCTDFCSCPEARSRIYQMYNAFLNYGLIKPI